MNRTVDVIVPVYRGLDETRACLESVWSSRNKTAYRLIVIDDCSPEPELSAWLREVAESRPMTLLVNSDNLGFVATVNKGMRASDENDVVLLNSDAEVANDWLDRLLAAAHSDARIGTVTPFSNNATICSYPAFCRDNELPAGFALPALDQLFAHCNTGETIDIPTAVGFCMYIRRDCLQAVGLFDVERFGKGYGEENDFCCRARKAGWRNVLACDTFVWHKGNVSFGDSHNARKQTALDTLRDLHPEYDGLVQAHLQEDPAREARLKVDIARWQASPLPRVLLVNHSRGGGTEQHCRELADSQAGRAHFFKLSPHMGELNRLDAYDRGEAMSLWFRLPYEYEQLKSMLQVLQIGRVHIHHTLGLDPCIWELAPDLGVPQDFTAHDYFPMCPQITLTGADNRYCGEEGIEQCQRCLRTQAAPGGVSIEQWRAQSGQVLSRCERLITPDPDVARRYKHYFPTCNVEAVAHPDSEQDPWSDVMLTLPGEDEPLRVAVLGAMSPMKGPDLLEATARNAQERALPIRFKLFGYAYRTLATLDTLDVHGPYKEEELKQLLQEWRPHVVWFPTQWPETYSYTLSECFRLGLPVLTTDLGATAQRVQDRPHSWILPWQSEASAWNDWLLQLRDGKISAPGHAPHPHPRRHFYRDEYLAASTRIPPAQAVDVEALRATRPHALGWTQHARGRMLGLLIYLRAHPALGWISKRIPVSWQRRLKNRLLGLV